MGATMSMVTDTIAPVASPFVVVVDSREQEPFEFYGLRADADQSGAPLNVRTVTAGLAAGNRDLAAALTYRLLERVWKDSQSGRLAAMSGGNDA